LQFFAGVIISKLRRIHFYVGSQKPLGCLLSFLALLFLSACQGGGVTPQKEGIIPVGASGVYYCVYGTGEPVLLLHGGFLDHHMWDQQIKALSAENYQVIALDLPGHGRSTDSDSTLLIQDYLKAVLDSLSLEKVSLVGFALGGTSATDFTLAYPERVKKLLLVSAAAIGYEQAYPVDPLSNSYLPAMSGALRAKDDSLAAAVFTTYWCDGTRDSTDIAPLVRSYVYSTALRSVKDHGWRAWARFAQPPAFTRLAALRVPVRIVYGEKDLPLIRDVAHVLVKRIPGATSIEMEGVGHMLNMEVPAAFNHLLLTFLQD
jgi:pimeloyl-ACP methyl ester carboxylesterase